MRIYETMYAYENNFVDSITQACYEDMNYSLGRIQDRIKGNYTGAKEQGTETTASTEETTEPTETGS